MKIAIAGIGFVGLSNAILLSQNHEVFALDIIPEKIEQLNNKISPIVDSEIEDFLVNKNINFMATTEGLEDQMLGIVVATEEPELEETRGKLIVESAANQQQLKELEDKILELLSSAEGNILDDEVLINTLSASKVTSNNIEQRVAVAEKMQAKISATRVGYRPVAYRASLLYFCVADLNVVEPMYQYSFRQSTRCT